MRNRSVTILLVALLAALGLLDVTVGLRALVPFTASRFTPETTVGPVAVGDLTRREATDRVWEAVAHEDGVELRVSHELLARASWEEMGVRFDVEESVARAYANEQRSFIGYLTSRTGAKGHPLKWSIDTERMNAFAESLASKVYRAPKNALVERPGPVILPEERGRYMDVEGFGRALEDAIRAFTAPTDRDGRRVAVQLPISTVEPSVDAAQLRALLQDEEGLGTALLTGFTTHYDPSNEGRASNLELAARLIDGTILRPGDRFSFNEIVGPRRLDLGFLPAPEIVGEEFVEGVGGGICQVSSTLFNAVLFADLDVVERYRHSVPLGYVPPGRDATLHYGVMDFAFVNSSVQTIVVRAQADDGTLKVKLWGDESLPFSVALSSEERVIEAPVDVEVDESLPPGERVVDAEGRPGKWIILYKRVTDKVDGAVLADEVVSRNHYPPKARKVRIGGETASPDGEAASER